VYFIKGDIIVALFVDDICLFYKNENEFHSIKELLMSQYEMRDLGPLKKFLGLNIVHTAESLTIDNESYINYLLKLFRIEDANPVATPMENKIKFNPEAKPYEGNKCSQLIGCLMYLTVTCRPDIAYATVRLSQFRSLKIFCSLLE